MDLTYKGVACLIEVDLYASGQLSLRFVQLCSHQFIGEVLCVATLHDTNLELKNDELLIQANGHIFEVLHQAQLIGEIIRTHKNTGYVVRTTSLLEKQKQDLLKKFINIK